MGADSSKSIAVEDYLKRIYFLQEGRAEAPMVATGEIARAMEVSPPSATAMVRRLAREGLVDYEPYRGARLSPTGFEHAVGMIRRHRLIETLLHQVLGLDWTEVHAEAERLEHAVSEKVLRHIDEHLGYPTSDPHGDPIPHTDGRPRHEASRPLSACEDGETVVLARVTRQDPRFLKFLAEHGLTPGVPLRVLARDADAGVLRLEHAGETVHLSSSAASSLLVE